MAVRANIQSVIEKIRLRVSDVGRDQFDNDTEIVQAGDDALSTIWTDVRLSQRDHYLQRLDLTATDFIVTGKLSRYTLPEMVRSIRKVEALVTDSSAPVAVEEADPENKDGWGGRPVWYRDQFGQFTIVGNVARMGTVRIYYLRGFSPMHFGTAGGSGSTTTLVFSASPSGTIVRRRDVHVDQELEFTAGPNIGSVVRITDYNPATNTATFTPAVGSSTTTADSYATMLPLVPEHVSYFIEYTVTKLLERGGNVQYIAARNIQMGMLRQRFLEDVQHRDQDAPLRLHSSR